MMPWVITYPCHLVPFGEGECQPNVKRAVMIHLVQRKIIFPHPTSISLFISTLPSPNLSFCNSCLSLINCQYVGQNYLNIFASFSIFSSLVISLYNSMMFSSKFSLALWTRDLSFAKVDVSSLKWNKIKCFFIWSNHGFGIVMYLIAKPLKYRDIKSERADTRTVTRLHS